MHIKLLGLPGGMLFASGIGPAAVAPLRAVASTRKAGAFVLRLGL
jgi:hypothetical protein